MGGDVAEQLKVRGASVDATDVAAICADFAAQNQPTRRIGIVQPIFRQELIQGRSVFIEPGEGELGFDRGNFAAGANPLAAGAIAQQQTDRVDDDGFACTSFAGHNIQAGTKRDAQIVYDCEVAVGKFR